MNLKMNDLTEYARSVEQATDLAAAKKATYLLIDQFQFASKKQQFKLVVDRATNKQRLVKWAWDLVLVGDNLKVLK